MHFRFATVTALVLIATESPLVTAQDRSFGEDVSFLRQHVETIVLGDPATGSAVVVVPDYQARVMTSTATGNAGTSYGWINYQHIESGNNTPHINVYGGEERFWLGPEGGQFSIFFKPGSKFEFEQWQTPKVIDTATYQVSAKSQNKVVFRHETTIENYSANRFGIRIDREIELLSNTAVLSELGLESASTDLVAYRTTNRLTNIGKDDWTKARGLLSIWLLGMYKHGPQTTVVIPYRQGGQSQLGPIVNDDYFGKVPADRLKISDGVIYFSGDGQLRSKIGLNAKRSTPICGSYDATRQVLTVVKYNQPAATATDYVNSKWELQNQPYAGDVINSYNDGPAQPGAKPLGPFYELETSSPALALKRGRSGIHIQITAHFEGSTSKLDLLARQLLGVSLTQIETALK